MKFAIVAPSNYYAIKGGTLSLFPNAEGSDQKKGSDQSGNFHQHMRGHLAVWVNNKPSILGYGRLHKILTRKKIFDGGRDLNPAVFYLQSYLRKRGYDSSCFKRVSPELINYDIILLSSTFLQQLSFANICKQIREITDAPIFVGGQKILGISQWLSNKEYVKDNFSLKDVTFIRAEFGEPTIIRALENLHDLSNVPNLTFFDKSGNFTITDDEAEEYDLDENGVDWSLIDEDILPYAATLRTSVGCPFKCRYCDFIKLHPRLKIRKIESLKKEINSAKDRGIGRFIMADDNIFLNRKRVLDVIEVFKKLDVQWGGFFRGDTLDEKSAGPLYESGLFLGRCGIESGDQNQLIRMKKDCDLGELKRGLEAILQFPVNISMTLLLGFPGETKQSIDNTINFINNLNVGEGFLNYHVWPLYIPELSSMVDPSFADKYNFKFKLKRGESYDWSHNTMHCKDLGYWLDYMHKNLKISAGYGDREKDFFKEDFKKKRSFFDSRTKLTNLFWNNGSKEAKRRAFEEVCKVVTSDYKDYDSLYDRLQIDRQFVSGNLGEPPSTTELYEQEDFSRKDLLPILQL